MVWSMKRLNFFKYFEALESVLETTLQYYLLFKKTKSIKNIVPYLKSDFKVNGYAGSLICSLALSEFSFTFFALNKCMLEPYFNRLMTIMPSNNVGSFTILKLSAIVVLLQFSRMIIFIACMNGYLFILAYFLLHLLLNKYWFVAHVTDWASIINATFFSMKGIYSYEDTKTKRTFYRSLLYSVLEVTLLWSLAFISKFFGNLVKEEVAESAPLLTLFSLVILSNPIGVYIQLRTFRRNNFFTACACGDLDILREMIHSPNIDFNSIDHYHRTGFIIACQYGQF